MQISCSVKSMKKRTIKAIIMDIIVAFIGIIVIVLLVSLFFGKKIKSAINTLDIFSIDTNSKVLKELKFDTIKKKLNDYPEIGERFGNIKIESLDVNLPLYYGDKLSIIKNGVGLTSGAYFPGEGGSVICMGHNTKAFLYNLPEIKEGAIIEVTTSYGNFKYKVYQTKIVDMYNVDELPIQDEKEIFMIYTCYPVNTLGHKTDRFVVYATPVEE